MTYFERLKNARLAKGLSQRKLAEMVHVAPASLNAYEKGDKKPTVDVAYRMAQTLGVSLDWLFDEDMTQEQSNLAARSQGDIARAIHILCTSGLHSGVHIEAIPVEWEQTDGPDDEPVWVCADISDFPEEDVGVYVTPNGYRGEITVMNKNLSTFIGGYQKLLELYKSKDIDWDMFSAWVEKKLVELDKIPIQQNE